MDQRRCTLFIVAVLVVGRPWCATTRSPRTTLVLLAVLAPSIILHEVSHGVVALAFGDDTAKQAGRLTLNPIAHVDPFGTVILPALLAFSGGPPSATPNRCRSTRDSCAIRATIRSW